MTFRYLVPTRVHLLLAGCFVVAFLSTQPRADPTPSNTIDLKPTIRKIDQVLAKTAKTSSYYRLNKQYLLSDFGFGAMNWNAKGEIRPSPLSDPLRHLITQAVCWKNSVAVQKAFEVSNLIDGGLFNDLQRDYLQKISENLSLELTFKTPRQSPEQVSNSDLNWINNRKRLRTALNNSKLDQALGMLPAFALLCRKHN